LASEELNPIRESIPLEFSLEELEQRLEMQDLPVEITDWCVPFLCSGDCDHLCETECTGALCGATYCVCYGVVH
jgi:hypothetical protein